MAKIIKTDGNIKYVKPKNNKDFSLEELQKIIGGHIQIVKTKRGKLMVINEEGKLLRLQKNRKATDLYEYGGTDIIVGDVLVIDKDQIL